jgi:hypothetical protein
MKTLKALSWTIFLVMIIGIAFTLAMFNAGIEGFVTVIEVIAGVVG